MPWEVFVAPGCHGSGSPRSRAAHARRLASRMCALKGSTYFAIVLSILLNARTQGADAPSVEQCPGAASWSRSHPTFAESPRSESGSSSAISDAELLTDLKVRVESDQAARKKWVAGPKSKTLGRSVEALDTANLTWLRQLISEKGFPTAAQVGNEGVHLAWILLQHADQDPKLQSGLLPVLEQRFAAGELPANDLARITDRVLAANGKPQRYGTQFDWFSGEFKLPEPNRLAEIDNERSHVGLMPLADYVCTIRKAREKLK
jgi:hypothetical protein